MIVAVLKETRPGERRVALAPKSVKALTERGFEIVVESGAGVASGFMDESFTEAGARIAEDAGAALSGASVLAAVRGPQSDDTGALNGRLPEDGVLIAFLDPMGDAEGLKSLAEAGTTAFAMEAVPRITRAQKMDALSSQATVAGYRAALLGAQSLGRFLPMLTTAAGTIRPARTLILGAGVAGLQAIATARRLGAVVSAFDVRPAVKEQVQSLGATFLEAELEESAEDEGGYAKALSEEQHKRELELLAAHVPDADIVITTAQIPGRPAPLLVTKDMVERMKPGSVVVDLASETGGNCELTEAGRTVEHAGVKVLGPLDLASTLPVHASEMYGKNVEAFLLHLAPEGELVLDFDDEITAGACVAHAGELRFGPARERLGLAPLPVPAAPVPEASDSATPEGDDS